LDGLPPESTEQILESELRAKLRGVVGVSVCYALRGCENEVESGMAAIVHRREQRRTVSKQRHINPQQSLQELSPNGSSSWWRLTCVDSILSRYIPTPASEEETDLAKVEEAVCAGRALIVFETEEDVQALLRIGLDENSPSREILGTKVKWARCQTEPLSINWMNYECPDVRSFNLFKRMGIGLLCVFLAIVLWACLYIPYALECVMYTRIPGVSSSALNDLVLGCLIGVGNVIVGNVIEMVIDWSGFYTTTQRHLWVFVLIIVSNLCNLVADLWIAVAFGQGARIANIFGRGSVGYESVVEEEMVSLIVPGYLFTPYIMQLLFELWLPYWVYRWLVRSNKGITRHRAEAALVALNFDIVWHYADMLNNVLICTFLLPFITAESARIYLYLVGFFVFTYVQDKARLLHFTSQFFYTSAALSEAFAICWSVPTAMMAGSVAWWGMKGAVLPPSFGVHVVWIASMIHIPVYLLGLRAIQCCMPSHDADMPSYSEAIASRQRIGIFPDYFNTNPGLCLHKSNRNAKKPTFPYVRGKLHLLDDAPHSFAPGFGPKLVRLSEYFAYVKESIYKSLPGVSACDPAG
jgi:hypothetical protein